MSNKDKKNIMNNGEIADKALLAMIDSNTVDVDVPERLKPDNMMKHIRQLKSEGYFEERKITDKTAEEQYAGKQKLRRVKRWATAAAAVFCIILFVPHGETGYKDNPWGSYQAIVDAVQTEDEAGNYVLSGYKELAQYAIASSSLQIKDEEVVESLFDKVVAFVDDVKLSTYNKDCVAEEWGDLSGDDNFSYNQNGGETQYSETNVRTDGVDESDVVKTDGEYIYYIDDDIGRIQLVIAKPDGENTAIVSRTDIDYEIFCEYMTYVYGDSTRFSTNELYVYGDKVVMLLSGMVKSDVDEYMDESRTLMLVYDTSDILKPELISQFELEGKYESSRLVDGHVYLFAYKPANLNLEKRVYTEEEAMSIIAPKICDKSMKPEQIYVSEGGGYDTFKLVVTLDVNNPAALKDVKAVLGSGSSLKSYVSSEHIYFISNIYNSQQENVDDKSSIESMYQAEILKFDYKDGLVCMEDRAVIDGTLGDEFDIDEYNGYLRIAITKSLASYTATENKYTFFNGESWFDFKRVDYRSGISNDKSSELCILDENLNIVSNLVLQRNESVYGVRFDGDVAYVVTYRQTDPLFSVDLSDPYTPKLMGALKIPGFSTYLHKWDDNTLVGIGYVANEDSYVKISVFDISDKYDITETGTYKLPSNGYSYAPLNHKEIFISPEKKLIGMWMNGRFIVDDETCQAVYLMYSYVDGEFTQVIKCPLESDENAENTRAMYIGEYIYIVNTEDGIAVYSMEDYTKITCIK